MRTKAFVVETWLPSWRRWYVWSAWVSRKQAWSDARQARAEHPKYKFRTMTYERVKP